MNQVNVQSFMIMTTEKVHLIDLDAEERLGRVAERSGLLENK